jgi:LEA14-like dessication related protein
MVAMSAMLITPARTGARPRVGLAAAVGAFLLLAGCAAIPMLESPKATVAAVRLDALTGVEARFAVLVDLVNPNDRAIAVDAIDAELTIEAIAVGSARLVGAVQLPPRGETTATLEVRTSWAHALRAFATGARRTRGEANAYAGLRYAVTGSAALDGGRTIPFSRSGEFSVSAGASPRP